MVEIVDLASAANGLSRLGASWLVFFGFVISAGAAEFCDLKPDEEMVFFPSMACRSAGGTYWSVEVRGCVFEPEKRRLALAGVSAMLKLHGVKTTEAQKAVLHKRAPLFLGDNERGKEIVVRLGGRLYNLGKTGPDGWFSGSIQIADGHREPGKTMDTVEAVLPNGDSRHFRGAVHFIPETGLTVISDIDDTLKITCVRDRNAMLRNSFLEPFRAVAGMAELYSAWDKNSGAQFCYVSASPWQFYAPLSEFVTANGFPAGVYALKRVRWKDRTFFDLFESPETYKLEAIESLFERFPSRRFVLVGDSGERDPEVYGELARRHPRQVTRILIRDATDEPGDSTRFEEAFRNLAPGLWRVFREADSLPIDVEQ